MPRSTLMINLSSTAAAAPCRNGTRGRSSPGRVSSTDFASAQLVLRKREHSRIVSLRPAFLARRLALHECPDTPDDSAALLPSSAYALQRPAACPFCGGLVAKPARARGCTRDDGRRAADSLMSIDAVSSPIVITRVMCANSSACCAGPPELAANRARRLRCLRI